MNAVDMFFERARRRPDRCALCIMAKAAKRVDLVALDDAATRVEHRQLVPLCEPCLAAYLSYAGDAAALIPGAKP
jgi:hypothetical protein